MSSHIPSNSPFTWGDASGAKLIRRMSWMRSFANSPAFLWIAVRSAGRHGFNPENMSVLQSCLTWVYGNCRTAVLVYHGYGQVVELFNRLTIPPIAFSEGCHHNAVIGTHECASLHEVALAAPLCKALHVLLNIRCAPVSLDSRVGGDDLRICSTGFVAARVRRSLAPGVSSF
jgi:hypothetical protein